MSDWGGKREGSGRKPIDPDTMRVQMSVSVTQETRLKARVLRENGIRLGAEIDQLVDRLIQDLESKK